MMKALGYLIVLIGVLMMVCPQANTGLPQLKWLYNFSFQGEAFVGAIFSSLGYLCFKPNKQG